MFLFDPFGSMPGNQSSHLKSLINKNGAASNDYAFLRSTAEEILGPFYPELVTFFRDIFTSESFRYIVFVARKSIGLAELFFRIFWSEATEKKDFYSLRLLESAWSRSLTDSTIMSCTGEIAAQFQEGYHPRLLIVDDILIQGNSLNEFLSTIEHKVIRELEALGAVNEHSSKDSWWTKIVNSIHIRVFAQNSKLSVVNLHYQMRLRPANILNPMSFHDFSNRVSNLFTVIGIANTSFIMSAEISHSHINDKEAIDNILSQNHLSAELPVSVVSTDIDTLFERHYLGWYPHSTSAVPYYCSLRLIKNCYTDTYRLLPFIFLPRLRKEKYALLTSKVFIRWGIEPIAGSRLRFEAVILHLSTSLLNAWAGYLGIRLTSTDYDTLKVSLNYGLNRNCSIIAEADFQKLFDSNHLFSWQELLELLDEVTADEDALCVIPHTTEAFSQQRLQTCMEDWVYLIKIQELTESFRNFSALPPDNEAINGISLEENRRQHWNIPLNRYLNSILQQCPGASIDQVFAQLLHFMDQGTLTLRVLSRPSASEQALRIAGQALTLWPRRYQKFHLVLKLLTQRVIHYRTNLETELRTFLEHEKASGKLLTNTNVESLTNELTEYLERLRRSGQTLEDWDIRFARPAVLYSYQNNLQELYLAEQNSALTASIEAQELLLDCRAQYRV